MSLDGRVENEVDSRVFTRATPETDVVVGADERYRHAVLSSPRYMYQVNERK